MIKITFELEDTTLTAVPAAGEADTWLVSLAVTHQYMLDYIAGKLIPHPNHPGFPSPVAITVTSEQLAAILALAIGIGEAEVESTQFSISTLYALAELALPPDLHCDLRPIP